MTDTFVSRHFIVLMIWIFGYPFLFAFVLPFLHSISDIESLIPMYLIWTGIGLLILGISEYEMQKMKPKWTFSQY